MIETFTLFGTEISLYYTFWLIGASSVLLGGYLTGKWYGFAFSRSVLYVAGAIALGYGLLVATAKIFGGGNFTNLNFVRVVTFLPIPIYLLTFLYKDRFGDIADFLAPWIAVYHGVTHLGCIFEGCCHGYPAQWGLYSNIAGTVCFPIQPIEAVSSILIGVILLTLAKKQIQTGKLYGWYLTLFGATRFVWEFFRDNTKVWNNVSELALHALVAFILGAATLVVANFLKNKEGKTK